MHAYLILWIVETTCWWVYSTSIKIQHSNFVVFSFFFSQVPIYNAQLWTQWQLALCLYKAILKIHRLSGVARAFPGGRAIHLENQNEEENEERLRKSKRTYRKMRKDWGNVLILPTQEWEAGYGPAQASIVYEQDT